MMKTEPMRKVLFIVRTVTIVLIVFLAVVAFAKTSEIAQRDNTNTLSDTSMWFVGLILSGFLAVAAVLRKHENDITKMQSDPEPVPKTECQINIDHINSELSHGTERFEKIEQAISGIIEKEDNSQARHEELKTMIKSLKA